MRTVLFDQKFFYVSTLNGGKCVAVYYILMNYINETFWWEALGRPNWYELLADDFKRLEQIAATETDYSKRKAIKNQAYELVEKALKTGHMPLAGTGYNFDSVRQPINTIVLHHTANPPGMTLERLNAMQLLRIYGGYFANPTEPEKQHVAGKPVQSGHFYRGKQVFWVYHWFVRADGATERILDDSYIGWQAGNWEVNKQSVAICIDDDLSTKEPSETVLKAIAELIKCKYQTIQPNNIIGHCDVNIKTDCPGSLFHKSWRNKLLAQIFP